MIIHEWRIRMNIGEQLIIAMENALESARGVYRETEKLVDAVPNPNDLADRMNNEAYGDLLKAGQLIEYARHICQLGAFPSYAQLHGYTAGLVEKGREQSERIERHLSFVGLRDDDARRARRDFAQAFIDGVGEVQGFRERVYQQRPTSPKYPEFGRTLEDQLQDPDFHVRLLDGLVECSIDAVEDMAGAVRSLTRLVP